MPTPYSKQTWVDNTTPVDASHMSHMEDGIANADASLTYLGDYAAGTYNNGDVVVAADGFSYVCVKDGTTSAPVAFPGSNGGIPLPVVNGQWIKGVGGAAVWAAIAPSDIAGYPATAGTSFPGSPADGDEYVYAADPANGVYWRFKYRTATAKWIFIGGAPLYAEVTPSETNASTTYAAVTTPGPSVALPFAGDYIVEIGCQGLYSNGSTPSCYMSYDIGATGAVDADAIINASQVVAGGQNLSRLRRKTGLTAVTLTAKYRATAGTLRVQDRWMAVWPVQR